LEKTTAVIKNLKKGHFILIEGVPCRVESVTSSKSGKHGASKTRVEAIGTFLGKMVGGKKGIIVPYPMVQAIGDVVIIKHITAPLPEEGESK